LNPGVGVSCAQETSASRAINATATIEWYQFLLIVYSPIVLKQQLVFAVTNLIRSIAYHDFD
jgi:hypothetical protein